MNLLLINARRLTKDLENLTTLQEKEKNKELKWIPPKDYFMKINFDGALLTMK